jgi:7-keto-8-aminopelargonate synthetase-like enzyme
MSSRTQASGPALEQHGQQSHLENSLALALSRRRQASTLRNLTLPSANAIDFSSNDFLSLSTSSTLRDLYLSELAARPNFPLGSGGSRLLDGNSRYAEALEKDISAFHGAKDGLLCNSGFDANAGLFSVLPQPGDVVVYDAYIHASVHDGMRASRAGANFAFEHNSVSDLRAVLTRCIESDAKFGLGRRSIFIAVEAIYSMDGDVAPLKEIVELVTELLPNGNGHVIVDEAHSTGVLGPQGRGLVSALGLEDKITVRLHTFGKAMACNGGTLTVFFSIHHQRKQSLLTRPLISNHPLQPSHQTLPNQLRPPTNLHNLPFLPLTRSHQSRIHFPVQQLHHSPSHPSLRPDNSTPQTPLHTLHPLTHWKTPSSSRIQAMPTFSHLLRVEF